MPTYEYACKACGEHLEVVQSFKDDSLTTCPACGGALRKVFGSIGIAFKGSGFYRTDSRPAAKGDKPDKPETAASSDGSKSAEGSTSAEGSKKAESTKGEGSKKADVPAGSGTGTGAGAEAGKAKTTAASA
jgi:putative FmdB family regulatory protein